jgi:hypothetical protein
MTSNTRPWLVPVLFANIIFFLACSGFFQVYWLKDNQLSLLSIGHNFFETSSPVSLGCYRDLMSPYQDSFGTGAHDLLSYRLGTAASRGS